MSTKTTEPHASPSIVPIDGETSAMLDYAESAAAKIKIENARHEIKRGEGILPTPDYFADLNRRIAEHTTAGGLQPDA
jgi:hypothetical protein